MTANYGELRPNHFHTGIDFTTHGEIKRPVYSIQEGYVSRVRVGPAGYGNCVYITHPGGKVSVYAHLNAFSLKIDKVVRDYRRDTQSNEVELLPKPRIYVRKNEIIGLSGNSGNSTGPHLHFEIRDELSEVPLNPLLFYKIKDNTPPTVEQLAIYDLADTLNPRILKTFRIKTRGRDSLYLENDEITTESAIIGFAFSGLDRFTATGSPNNIFSVTIDIDGLPFYGHKLNNIPFTDLRFINEYKDETGNTKFQKCFMPTIFPYKLYDYTFTRGRTLLDTSRHTVLMSFSDECGNTRRLLFYIRPKKSNYYEDTKYKTDLFVNCSKDTAIFKNNLRLDIYAGSFFNSSYLELGNKLSSGKLSIEPVINLRQPVRIGFKIPERYAVKPEKLVLVGSKTGTNVATVRNDSLYFTIKTFGDFKLMYDSAAPKIKIRHTPKQIANAWQMESFSFTITDELSGIAKYNLWLNNTWVQCDYDAKNDELIYYFDDDSPFGLLKFKLEVEDKCGNKREFDYLLKK